MLPHKERLIADELESTHGVLIVSGEDMIEAYRKDDAGGGVIAEAPTVHELKVVLQSMHIYPRETSDSTS